MKKHPCRGDWYRPQSPHAEAGCTAECCKIISEAMAAEKPTVTPVGNLRDHLAEVCVSEPKILSRCTSCGVEGSVSGCDARGVRFSSPQGWVELSAYYAPDGARLPPLLLRVCYACVRAALDERVSRHTRMLEVKPGRRFPPVGAGG